MNKNHHQQGFLLLELAVVALIALFLSLWAANAWQKDVRRTGIRAHFAWMDGVRQATQNYLARYEDTLAVGVQPSALAASGYGDWRTPSIKEFKADGLLPAGYPELGPLRMPIQIRVHPAPGCQADCRMQALIYGRLVQGGAADQSLSSISEWLLASEGRGGQVSQMAPEFIRGPSFSWGNPPDEGMARLAHGTVALVASQASGPSPYLRVGDTRNPDFQGGLDVKGDIKTAGSLATDGYLFVGAQAYRDDACTQEGMIARDGNGGLLFCRYGYWRPNSAGGGGFSINSRRGCQDADGNSSANPVTGGCHCPHGYTSIRIADSGESSASGSSGRTLGFLCVN